MPSIIDINKPDTWPDELHQCLEKNHDLLVDWNFGENPDLDETFRNELKETLFPHCVLGYHCTRLTDFEIGDIEKNGLLLSNPKLLERRIDRLVDDNLINNDIAKQLKKTNHANKPCRIGEIWFCFFELYASKTEGIYKFFRYWGGESLYRIYYAESCEQRKMLQGIISEIGTPCVIKANVPISKIEDRKIPCNAICKVYQKKDKKNNFEIITSEGNATKNIPRENIQDIIKYPSKEFKQLTNCENWSESLQ